MASELASTEDVVNALLDYLVEPRLPLKSSAVKEAPTLSQQQSVAKQLHAVVLLYNYYQRKQNPPAQYLDFESFCKLAVTLKPALVSYMKFTNESDPTASKDMDNDLSVTEKAIQDACNISCALDASKDVPSINKWLIAEVSVLLLDSKKETCWLPYSSVTDGVWSLLGKRLELPTAEIEGTVERKHLKKKRQTSMRPVTVEQNYDDSGFQQLAFLAVKDATGISMSDLVVLEKHVVYSLTKEKTASCFYIMQCTQSISQDIQIPVKEIFESFLQGPLVKRNSGNWSTTDVVEYFHLLPYASIMSAFFLREVSSLEGSNTRSHKDITDNCENEISESRISLFDQNSGNVSINDMYGRNANPADSFCAEVAANNGCERNTGDQKDLGKENDVHHHHETVSAYGSISGKVKEASASKGSKSVEEKIEKMEAKMPDESNEALIGTKSDRINLEISEASASKGSKSVEDKIEKMEAKTPDESYEASIGTKSDHINLEISEAKDGDGSHEKVSDSAVALIGTKSDCINLEISEAKDGDGCHVKVSHSAVALIGTKSDCINLEISEAKNGDGFHEKVSHSAVALIGTKSDCINLEISESKNGDGFHEKVSHSAVGQEATAVGSPHMTRKSEEAGSGSSIKNTKIVDFSGVMLTGVNVKCLNDTSNKVHGENSRDSDDSTVKELHGIINHPRTTEELLKSTKTCEINDYTDVGLAGAHLEPLEVKIIDGYHSFGSPTRSPRMDIDACIPCSKNGNNIKDCKLIKEVYHHQKKRTRESGGAIIGSGIICKAQRTDEGKADKECDLSSISPDQNGIFVANAGFVPYKHESSVIGDLQTVLASKEKALTKSSLQVLLHKRQKLCHQQRKIDGEIALCDKSIQGILDGGKDSLTLKLDTLLDFCDEMCFKDRAAILEDGHQPHEEFGLIQPMSGRKLSKAVRTP